MVSSEGRVCVHLQQERFQERLFPLLLALESVREQSKVIPVYQPGIPSLQEEREVEKEEKRRRRRGKDDATTKESESERVE